MNVLIAQSDPDIALKLAEQVARAGGRVSGIVLQTRDALDRMGGTRAPDILFLDVSMSEEAEGADPAVWERIKGRICLCGLPSGSGAKARHWPVLKDADALEDIRLVLLAARHFGRPAAALH